MIGFSGREILLSILYAAIYGAIFCVVIELVKTFIRVCKAMPKILCSDFKNIKYYMLKEAEGDVFAFLCVFSFFLGYLLLSYFSLDGQLRLYMLIISSAVYFLSKMTFLKPLKSAISVVFAWIFFLFCFPIRSVSKFAGKMLKFFNII